MQQGIGETFTYNIIILFIIVVFAILAATISYYKAFKVNNRVLDSIEKFEGYNAAARADIESKLKTLGYTVNTENAKCPERKGMTLEKQDGTYLYCVYYHEDDTGVADIDASRTGNTVKNGIAKNRDNEPVYYNYSVASYIYIDLPIVGQFKIPVYTKGERTYNFSCKKCNASGECTFRPKGECGA